MQGSCLCGGVTVRIPSQPGLELCHCTHCRRQCGTGTFFSVAPSDLLVTGEVAEYAGTSDAGNELKWYWCPVCGGKVYQTSSGFKDVSVHAGLFPAGTIPRPNREIWLRSAEKWYKPYPGADAHEKG
ncbi:hypothetical protein CC85DRAFT_284528 [Cutaneotrichosporon oleaginosum]|uniref:CENP-V/GFA domain-containing protein n=1 Tax=Cutaneotrichosporon oleaginosum TaxID=879819 RepID=A0A0J0XQH7_9TREE|nr:uncharacterized protein CC85DRAFT_284528 [Cutaneotrichosporon oleaginosum]KLT43381.1 hypothetical protein CC85DRAFT_284528 [Cutaneotrichosporon oleaginosum]TXT05405.1 hypothetical protein COLE_06725 [Cutaneotrichosporon oleaginosum]